MIALERDVTTVSLSEKRHLGEFALRDALLEVVTAKPVLEVFHPIDVVLAFLGTDH